MSSQVAVKTGTPEEVERLVRLLEPRCSGEDAQERLRGAAREWESNGGSFSSPVVAEDDNVPSPVGRHRVLKELEKRLQKAVQHINATYDVRGLCMEFSQRLSDLVHKTQGDRLPK